jgi:hypothetical protein
MIFIARLLREADLEEVDSIQVNAADISEARRLAQNEFKARRGKIAGFKVVVAAKGSQDRRARAALQAWATKQTKCRVQNGWPCGTCFFDLLRRIGLNEDAPEYHAHNDPVDRANEVWRAVLQIRDDADPPGEGARGR